MYRSARAARTGAVKSICFAAALLAAAAVSTGAQTANGSTRDTLVVSPAWLAGHLHDADLVLVHAGRPDSYDEGHIPGARLPDLRGATAGSSTSPLTSAAVQQILASVGATRTSRIVVYAPPGMGLNAALLRFALESAGVASVAVLDGGLKAWTDAGQPISKDTPLPKTSTPEPVTLRPYYVDAAFVQAHIRASGFAIVDARAPAFYNGVQGAGHIPGAVNVAFNTVLSDDGALKPNAEIEAIFSRAGVKPGDTVIAYCHIGKQANAVVLAAQVTGHPVVLYSGSFTDWTTRQLPVEKPDTGKHSY